MANQLAPKNYSANNPPWGISDTKFIRSPLASSDSLWLQYFPSTVSALQPEDPRVEIQTKNYQKFLKNSELHI